MIVPGSRMAATGLIGLLWIVPVPTLAQGPSLFEVERLAEAGRFPQARAALGAWLQTDWGGAPRADRQRAVWLRALLSLEPEAADLDYRRLKVEYPGGAYSDQALVRLAQGSQARGDLVAAGGYLEELLRDYPQSPLRVEARSLLARLEERAAVGADGAASGVSAAPPPRARPDAPVDPTAGDRGRSASGGGLAPAPAPAVERSGMDPFTIQLGAFSTERRALSLMLEARAVGLEPRLVHVAGSELFRIRLEQFATRGDAERRSSVLREQGFQAVVSSDRELEEMVR